MAPKRRRHPPAVKHFYPLNRRRTYLGDIRAAPFAVAEGGAPATPYLGLWADADTGEVVSTVVAIERPAEALAEALINPTRLLREARGALDESAAGAVAVADSYELPGRAVVFDASLAAILRPRLASRGIAVQTAERIEFFEKLLASLFDHLAATAPPPAMDIPDEVLAPLCAAAERLWNEKPWRYCYDDPPIGVEPLDGAARPVYAVVLGRAGEVFGVALYSSLDDYEALARLGDPPDEDVSPTDAMALAQALDAAHRRRTFLVSFDEKVEADPGYVDRLVAAGWSRRRRVVPSFVAHGGGKPATLFSEAEARRFAPVLDAVTVFCQQARGRIAELDYLPIQLVAEVAVGTAGKHYRFRVTMPPDVPARGGRRRRSAARGTPSASPPVRAAARVEPAAGPTGIDDPAVAARLMDEMRSHLPIPASATPELARHLRAQGLRLGPGRSLPVKELFYMGDEGGICCRVTPPGEREAALVVSLTHLRIAPSHPLHHRIVDYQQERVRRIDASR